MLAVNFKDPNNTEGVLLNDLFLGTGSAETCPFTAGSGASNSDNIQIFDASTQEYAIYYLFYTTKTASTLQARNYRWNLGSAAASGSIMAPGQGAWYLHRGSGYTLPIKNQFK